jgi:cyclic beta-1,2-glucan synthetase
VRYRVSARPGPQHGDRATARRPGGAASWCVDPELAIKQVHCASRQPRQRTRTCAWSASRVDDGRRPQRPPHRATQRCTASACPPRHARGRRGAPRKLTALLATQRDRRPDSAKARPSWPWPAPPTKPRTGPATAASVSTPAAGWCCPTTSASAGAGLDPCAALSIACVLRPARPPSDCFLLGHAATRRRGASAWRAEAAAPASDQRAAPAVRSTGTRCWAPPGEDARPAVRRDGQPLAAVPGGGVPAVGQGRLLPGRRAPPAFATSCRTRWRWPGPRREMLRAQILLRAARQFAQGDVQHWWHAPEGAGVRTHFRTTCCGCRMPACTTCSQRRHRAAGRTGALHRRPADPEGAEDLLRAAGQSACRTPACTNTPPARSTAACGRRARPAADGQRRLERRHEPRRHEGAANRCGWPGSCAAGGRLRAAGARTRRRHRTRAALGRRRPGWQAALQGPAWDGQLVSPRLLSTTARCWARTPTPRPHRPDRPGLGVLVGRGAAGAQQQALAAVRDGCWSTTTPG